MPISKYTNFRKMEKPFKKAKTYSALVVVAMVCFILGLIEGWLLFSYLEGQKIKNSKQIQSVQKSEIMTMPVSVSEPTEEANNFQFFSFPNPFRENNDYDFPSHKTTAEMDMIRLSISIRERPYWEALENPEIIRLLAEDLQNMTQSEEKVDYILEELQYYKELQSSKGVKIGAVDGTWMSDRSWDDVLSIWSTLSRLEHSSSKTVSVLVDPSVNSYVAKMTAVSKKPLRPFTDLKMGERKLQFVPVYELMQKYDALSYVLNHTLYFPDYTVSEKFQWLPSEVSLRWGNPEFLSYINGIHPQAYPDMYPTIQRLLEDFIPLFDNVLTDLRHPRTRIPPQHPSKWVTDANGHYTEIPNILTIPKFTPPQQSSPVNLKGSRIQVMVKITSIKLTPKNPSYAGEPWTTQGMANEQIVAIGNFYYGCQNLKNPRLHFREASSGPSMYDEGDRLGILNFYNVTAGTQMNRELGSTIIRQGRAIAFPNILQSKVSPFELADPSKEGYLKFITFFLVDPSVHILSTERVPPQDWEWWNKEMEIDPDSGYLWSLIGGSNKYYNPLGINEFNAKYLKEITKEREDFVRKLYEYVFETKFSSD